MVKFKIIWTFVLLFSSMGLVSCDSPSVNPVSSCASRVSVVYSGPATESYCSSTTTYTTPVIITGLAQYKARTFDSSTTGPTKGLLAPSASRPIRFAEVMVKNSSGTVVQCAETDAAGNYSLQMPNDGGSYTLSVNSRADNSNYKAYILKCPEENTHYSLSTTFTSDATKALPTIVAAADGDILGGAFNLLDQVLTANDYLRAQVTTCGFGDCTNFTVAPQVQIFWEKGFDPSVYGAAAGSFFVPSSNNRLFIIGGSNGDTDNSDTDHFDNSVILHEYAHFLEHQFSVSDSPGGAHSLSGPLDPRLAWSEGFANFFPAAVQGIDSYVDTQGNISGSTDDYIRLNLEKHTGSYAVDFVADIPANTNEGNFRELSVARLLYDAIDTNNDSETITNGFPEIWSSMTASTGLKNTNAAFRSIGLLHDAQTNFGGSTDWATIRTTEKHINDRSEYSNHIVPNVGTCTGANPSTGLFTLTPSTTSNEDEVSYIQCAYSVFPNSECFFLDPTAPSWGYDSHLVLNNDFYHYKHSGGTLNLTLNYDTQSGTEANLNLFVYSGSARFGVTSDIENDTSSGEGISAPDGSIGTQETEPFSKSLPSGDYLINVKVNNQAANIGGPTNYELLIGGVRACPAPL